MRYDQECRYSEEHDWIRTEGSEGLVGITDYAQDQLSNVVFVELPEIGDVFQQGDVFAVVESVKAASECYLPASGTIIELNEDLLETPELVNEEPYTDGWFVRIALDDPSELDALLDAQEYETYVEQLVEKESNW
jgi:glycine cleavage system H protein